MDSTFDFDSLLSNLRPTGKIRLVNMLKNLNKNKEVHKVEFFSKYVDIIYMSKKSMLLIKFDFLANGSDEDWLADEEMFNNERPLYFSQSSHRTSPVYNIKQAKNIMQRLHPDYEISMVLACNYNIINYEDMVDEWVDTDIMVVHRLPPSGVTIPEFCPTVSIKKNKTNESQEYKGDTEDNNLSDESTENGVYDESFQTILDEFIKKELEGGDDNDESDSDDTLNDNEDHTLDNIEYDENEYFLSSDGNVYFAPKEEVKEKPFSTNPKLYSENPIEHLNELVGLKQVKEQMENFRHLVRLASLRNKNGLPTERPPLHAIFMGSPGTGKSTVAALYAKILKKMGLLETSNVVYRDRGSLLGPNYSNEESKVAEAIEQAHEGVLFIDEAYSLIKSNDMKDPGRNVIDALVKALSDASLGNWALVLAGYKSGMIELMNFNDGLSSRIPESNRFHFEDFSLDELLQIASDYCKRYSYTLTEEAHEALRLKISHDYKLRNEQFGNARYINTLFSSEIIKSMSVRLSKIKNPTLEQLVTIEKEDIPSIQLKDYKKSLGKLKAMVGLNDLKKTIESHLNMVKMIMMRNEQGIETEQPPMHMVFTGNPGTGKTTVASFIGEIYASLGLLSRGDVVYVERKDLVGQYIGDTEKNTKEVLNRAKGNVLFIDEAYTLAPKDNDKDYGQRALEVLLSTLAKENIDMLVIMAGYPNEIEEMLACNPGLKSRMPYTFHFNDYNTDELMQIADKVAEKSHYSFTPAARRELRKIIERQLAEKSENWGNARFVTRLISAQILPAMSNRLAALPPHKSNNKKSLSQIRQEDVLCADGNMNMAKGDFDESAVDRILKKLDALVGLDEVKSSIHDFVNVARYMHQQGSSYIDNEPLRWNFTGNTGTGKSTVAKIIAELLKAMNLLEKGHMIEVKAEEMYKASEYKTDQLLTKAMKRSSQGLLFIDGDATMFKRDNAFNSESLRFKLSSMTMELPGKYALVIAENEGSSHTLTRNLRECGVTSFDHTLHFPDYTEDQLLEILKSCLKRKRFNLSDEAAAHMAQYIHSLAANAKFDYANARTMSKLSHAIANNCMVRISNSSVTGSSHTTGSTAKAESTKNKQVLLADVEHFVWKNTDIPHIGFV